MLVPWLLLLVNVCCVLCYVRWMLSVVRCSLLFGVGWCLLRFVVICSCSLVKVGCWLLFVGWCCLCGACCLPLIDVVCVVCYVLVARVVCWSLSLVWCLLIGVVCCVLIVGLLDAVRCLLSVVVCVCGVVFGC